MDGSDLYITMTTMVELLNAQNLPEANIFAAINTIVKDLTTSLHGKNSAEIYQAGMNLQTILDAKKSRLNYQRSTMGPFSGTTLKEEVAQYLAAAK